MFGIEVLDVVISLIFIYLLFSLFVSAVNEILSQVFKVRGKELRFSIERMIGYKLLKEFYQNPKIDKTRYRSSLFYATPFWKVYRWFRKKWSEQIDLEADNIEKKITSKSNPSVIATETFADTILDLIEDENLRKELFEQAPFLKKIYDRAEGEVEELRLELENWFDEIMVYTSEWYKQKLKYILLALGFLTAVIFNVDSVAIFKTLANNPEARNAVVRQAEAYIESHNIEDGVVITVPSADTAEAVTSDTLNTRHGIHDFLQSQYNDCGATEACQDSVDAVYPTLAGINSAYKKMDRLVHEDIDQLTTALGIGWSSFPDHKSWKDWVIDWSVRILGWLVTAVAISLGAPFWFDLLKKVVNLKNEISKRRGPEKAN